MQSLQLTQFSLIVHFSDGFDRAMQGDLKMMALTPFSPAHSLTAAIDSPRFRGSAVMILLTPIPSRTFSMLTLGAISPMMFRPVPG